MGRMEPIELAPEEPHKVMAPVPTFRSRRASSQIHECLAAEETEVAPEIVAEDSAEPETPPTGQLFDAFVDRLAMLRRTNGQIG